METRHRGWETAPFALTAMTHCGSEGGEPDAIKVAPAQSRTGNTQLGSENKPQRRAGQAHAAHWPGTGAPEQTGPAAVHREVRGEATAETGPAPGETLKCLTMSTEVKPRAQEVTTQTHVRMKLLKTSDEETI